MKKPITLLASVLTVLFTQGTFLSATAEGMHDHEEHAGHDHADETAHAEHTHDEKTGGPNGGRVITSVEPHAEFLVTKQQKVEVRFLNDANEVVAPENVRIRAIGGSRSAPTRLTFELKEMVFISNETLPEGDNLPIILTIAKAGQAPVNERFMLNMSECPTCDYKEYACICDHGEHDHDDHAGHDHGSHEGHNH